MNRWQILSKCSVIKIALPHLLLSVIAAAFSLSAQGGLPANQSQPATIITIAAVMMVKRHEHQSNQHVQSVPLVNYQQRGVSRALSYPNYCVLMSVVRLTPNNGIRAGPTAV